MDTSKDMKKKEFCERRDQDDRKYTQKNKLNKSLIISLITPSIDWIFATFDTHATNPISSTSHETVARILDENSVARAQTKPVKATD